MINTSNPLNELLHDEINKITDSGNRGQRIVDALRSNHLSHNYSKFQAEAQRIKKLFAKMHENPKRKIFVIPTNELSSYGTKFLQEQGFQVIIAYNEVDGDHYQIEY